MMSVAGTYLLALSPTSHFPPFLSPASVGATLIRIQAGAKENLERKTDIAPPPPFNRGTREIIHFIDRVFYISATSFPSLRNIYFLRAKSSRGFVTSNFRECVAKSEVAKRILLGFDRRNAFDTRVSQIPAKRALVSNSIKTGQTKLGPNLTWVRNVRNEYREG